MRFASLTLSRYGQFEEAAFAFPRRGDVDLHLVVGSNEAGKTTLKSALVDFLFGIARGSPYTFRYQRRQIAIEAEIELGGETLRLERTTGSAGLVPQEAAARLAAALGDMSRDTFLATQAFSHDEMRAHADMLYRSRGELREVLMHDAGGLSHAVALLNTVRKEAGELFDRDRRRANNVEYLKLEKLWQQAGERYDTAELSSATHTRLQRAAKDAKDALDEQRRKLQEAGAAAAELDKLIAAVPLLATIEEREERLAAPSGPRLADGAVERLGVAREEPVIAERARQAEARVRAAEERLQGLVLDEDVLALAPDIERLVPALARLDEKHDTRRTLLANRSAAEDLAWQEAASLGLAADRTTPLDRLLPPAIERKAMLRHAGERGEREAALDRAVDALAERPASPPPLVAGPSEALREAIAAAQAAGAPRPLFEAADAALTEARRALAAAAAATEGDPVATTAPPAAEEGGAAEAAIAEALREKNTAEERLAEAQESLVAAQRTLRATSADIPTPEVLAAARAERDAIWQEIRAGRPLAEAGGPFEAAVASADGIADERFLHVEALIEARRAADDVAAAEHLVARRTVRRDALAAEHERLATAWAERLRSVGIALPPLDYRAWHERRRAREAAADAVRRAEADKAALLARSRALLAALTSALADKEAPSDPQSAASASGSPPLFEPTGAADSAQPPAATSRGREGIPADALPRALENALERALEAHKGAVDRAAEARAVRKAYDEAERDRPAREAALAKARSALSEWQETHTALAARCGVPADIDRGRLADLFDGMERIERHLADASRAAHAIAEIDDFLQRFADDAIALARRLAEEEVGGPRILASHLVERLRRAEAVAHERESAAEELDRARLDATKAADALREIRATIATDLAAAGLDADAPLADLQRIAEASDRRHATERSLDEAMAALQQAGVSLADARAARAEADAATLAVRRAALDDDIAELSEAVQTAHDASVTAREALKHAERDAAPATAAHAAFEREALAGEMAEVAAMAIARRLQATILGAARDTFAAEHRSPVLDRAARNFATFTGGAYDRLDVDEGADGGFLLAHRTADDRLVDVTGLSDGTRDQLVASVRLAAAEGCPLPFIADDLFVNADDQRAAAGFRVLAALARGRQVIYLTHHDHLAEVARTAVDGRATVVRLGNPR
ncbi:AAA family ATPase [Acuticoccus mangrovi]|uniref:AAA family ATPase n=1 Tax=Acuticoccus mangrovi TaxID=2796142 RepID=A0A934MDT1_9HYPH|nr:AAA family ATPase [Acuticoccus mangrovi]MBJ3776712.1 AAA family ATPase [Acuticoccus mangrovi]